MLHCVLNKPLALDVNKVCLGEEVLSLIRMKNQQKIRALLELYRYGKCGVMDKKLVCFCCQEFKAIKYSELLGMRYGDTNAIAQRV